MTNEFKAFMQTKKPKQETSDQEKPRDEELEKPKPASIATAPVSHVNSMSILILITNNLQHQHTSAQAAAAAAASGSASASGGKCYLDSSVHRLVFDNGSRLFKAGFAGEDAPRVLFPSVVARSSLSKVCVGSEALKHQSFNYPIDRGVVTNWDDMEEVFLCFIFETKGDIVLVF